MDSLTLDFSVKEIEKKDAFKELLSNQVWKNSNGTIGREQNKSLCVI